VIDRNRRTRNLVMLLVLLGFVALVYAVTIVRMGGG
jgi:hypothetical protein